MISPNTAPGTGLVVVWLPLTREDALSIIRPELHPFIMVDRSAEHTLRVGQRVTLELIHPHEALVQGFAAHVDQSSGCYPLECFDIAALPKAIIGILTSVKEDA